MALILANTYAPIRHCHVIIFLYLTHEILTLIFLFSHHHHVGSSSRRPSTVNHLVVDTTHHHHHTFSSLQQPIRPQQPSSSLLQICVNSIAAPTTPTMSTIDAHSSNGSASTPCSTTDLHLHVATTINVSTDHGSTTVAVRTP